MTKHIFKRILSTVLLAGLIGGGAHPLLADDAQARTLMRQAATPDKNSLDSLQNAFLNLWDAFAAADSASLRKTIESRINTVSDQYDDLLRDGFRSYLFSPYPSDRRFYSLYAKFGRRNGLRLYGELLLNENDTDGFDYIRRAAHAGDSKAEYYMAEILGRGSYGQEQNFAYAIAWLRLSAEHGYPPAYELLAEVEWDGIWNQPRNLTAAINHLTQAIDCYKGFTLHDADMEKTYKNYVNLLENTRNNMQTLSTMNYQLLGQQSAYFQGAFFSYLAIKLSHLAEEGTNDCLWMMGLSLNTHAEAYGGQFMTYRLTPLDMYRISIKWDRNLKGYTGWTQWYATDDTYRATVTILPDQDLWKDREPARNLIAYMKLLDIITHELAHCRFYSRYPKLAMQKKYAEGHATNSAYAMVKYLLYGGSLTPQSYAELYLSKEYTGYFNWFRNNYILPNGYVDFDKLDKEEKRSGNGNYNIHNRTQDPSVPRIYAPYKYYGKGFYGFM